VTWLQLFGLLLFSAHEYGCSQLVATRSLTRTIWHQLVQGRVDIISWLRPWGPRLSVCFLTHVLTRMLQGKSFYQKVVSGPVQNIFAFTKWHCIFKTLFENSEVYVIIRSIVAEIRNIFSVILDSVECFSHSIYLHIGTVALLCFATYIALCHFLIFYVEKRWQLMEPSKVISFPCVPCTVVWWLMKVLFSIKVAEGMHLESIGERYE
jgi:hypothetical protein